MNIETETLPNCLTTLRVEVPPDKVTKAWDAVSREYAKFAKIPGYRPGKAPRQVIEGKYKKEIREELQKRVLGESCREAIDEKKLRVISIAQVDDVEIGDDKTMRFTATLVTAPEFELPDYKNIPVQSKSQELKEEEVDQTLENLRNQLADFVDIEGRGLQMEDFAVIDYAGTVDGKPVNELFPKVGKPLVGNNDFWIPMSAQSLFPGFCENLIDTKVGEARAFEIEVPADFAVTELAGQKISYQVTIKGVKQKVLPELNDEFAAKILPGKSLAELRENARQAIEMERKQRAEREKRNQIMQHLLSKVECELPQNMVRQETRRILNEIVRENQARGIADEALKESEKELVGAASQGARDRLKGSFILLRIAEAEKISVTKEEFDERIKQLAARYQMTREKLLNELRERSGLEQINEEILTGKTLDFLSANATVQATLEPTPAT